MIIYLPTKKTFANQKEAKNHFGNHHYRRLVKKGDIYFTNYEYFFNRRKATLSYYILYH